jgi:ParB-like chromosome segregation protein Spo0J
VIRIRVGVAVMVHQIPVVEIQKTPMNPRQVVSRERIEALATTMRQIGVAQPLVLWLNKRAGMRS